MLEGPLNVLIVEDSEQDAVLLHYSLEELGRPLHTRRVESEKGLRQALAAQAWDIVLSDYSLPSFDAFKALAVVKELSPATPVIIVSGTIGEETAVAAMRAGACDYLMKDKLGRLGQAVQRQLVELELRSRNRAALAALRESEERFRLLVEGVRDYAIFMMDTQGTIISWNAGAERMLGYSETEAVGRSFAMIFSTADQAVRAPSNELSVARAAGRCDDERWHVRKGGSLFWASGVVNSIYDDAGDLTGFAKVMRDSTAEREQREEKEKLLQLAERRTVELQKLAATSMAINSALTLDEMLRIGTQQAAAIIGAHQASACMTVGQAWDKAVSSVFVSEQYAACAHASSVPLRPGLYELVCRDNDTVRLTQAELEGHAVWQDGLTTATGVDGELPLRGWLAAPLIGRAGNNLGLIQLSDKIDGEFTTEDEAVLVQIAQILSVAVENARLYTSLEVAHARKEKALDELREADRRKDEFLAMLSHELRSPLNVIGGHVQLLRLEEPGSEDFFESLDAIDRNMKAQVQLISDLLDVSRIITGKLMMEVNAFDLEPVIQQAAESVRFAAEAKGITLQLVIDPNLRAITGDPTRIQQILWNLLSNAVKFTPKHGKVTLSARTTDSKVVVSVQDSGQGISPEFLPHVFDRFHQEDSSKTRRFGGLGLGLAIVRHIVELHGGTVSAESAGKDSGSIFIVCLPVKPLVEVEDDSAPEEGAASGYERHAKNSRPQVGSLLAGIEILAVDDQDDARALMEKALTKLGAQVVTAGSAYEATQILAKKRVDIIISDIGMPEVNGFDFMRQWRSNERELRRERLPAAALTAYISDQDQAEVLKAGYDRFLFKPVKISELTNVILELAGKNRGRPDLDGRIT